MIHLPRLRKDQFEIVKHPAKLKVVTAGRRYGKTVMGGVVAINVLRQHGKVAWVAPTYRNTRPMWRWAEATCIAEKRLTINRGERTILSDRGGMLAVYSADNPASILGEAFHLVIVDEAARVSEEMVLDAITPTLADYDGDMILISTPRGKNYFYRYFQKGQMGEDGVASWQRPTNVNPIPSIQRAFEIARARLPETSFRQEWLAHFVDDGGEVFRNVRACAVATKQDHAVDGHSYCIGVDWAKTADYNVFCVFDTTMQAAVNVDRSQSVDYEVQQGRLWALAERFGFPPIVAERNSMGEAIIEQLIRDGLDIIPFMTTNASKAIVIDDLTLAFEQKTITIVPNNDMIVELEAYIMERLPSGLLRYNAPSGMHDDTVIALALAYYGGKTTNDDADDWIVRPT
jgi:phage terminase large subunit-like protein